VNKLHVAGGGKKNKDFISLRQYLGAHILVRHVSFSLVICCDSEMSVFDGPYIYICNFDL